MTSRIFERLSEGLQGGLLDIRDGYTVHHKTRDALRARGLVKVNKNGKISLTAKGINAVKRA